MDAGPEATTLSNLICKMVQIITNLIVFQKLGIVTEKKKKKERKKRSPLLFEFKVKGPTSNKCP